MKQFEKHDGIENSSFHLLSGILSQIDKSLNLLFRNRSGFVISQRGRGWGRGRQLLM